MDSLATGSLAWLARMANAHHGTAVLFCQASEGSEQWSGLVRSVHVHFSQVGLNRIDDHQAGLILPERVGEHVEMFQGESVQGVFWVKPTGEHVHLATIGISGNKAGLEGIA